MTQHQRFYPIDVAAALLKPQPYFQKSFCLIVPLNLPNSLYTKLFATMAKYCKCRFIFCPKFRHFQSILSKHYFEKFEFHASDFQTHGFAFNNLPYLLLEYSAMPTQRNDSPKTHGNSSKFVLGAELKLKKHQTELESLMTPKHVHHFTSRTEFQTTPYVTR